MCHIDTSHQVLKDSIHGGGFQSVYSFFDITPSLLLLEIVLCCFLVALRTLPCQFVHLLFQDDDVLFQISLILADSLDGALKRRQSVLPFSITRFWSTDFGNQKMKVTSLCCLRSRCFRRSSTLQRPIAAIEQRVKVSYDTVTQQYA